MNASLSIVDNFLLTYPWLEDDERLVGLGQGVSGPGFEDSHGVLIMCDLGAQADFEALLPPRWNNMPVVIRETGQFELDGEELSGPVARASLSYVPGPIHESGSDDDLNLS